MLWPALFLRQSFAAARVEIQRYRSSSVDPRKRIDLRLPVRHRALVCQWAGMKRACRFLRKISVCRPVGRGLTFRSSNSATADCTGPVRHRIHPRVAVLPSPFTHSSTLDCRASGVAWRVTVVSFRRGQGAGCLIGWSALLDFEQGSRCQRIDTGSGLRRTGRMSCRRLPGVSQNHELLNGVST